MKKLMQIVLVVMILIPLVVNAANCNPEKITIEEITMKNKSEGVTEVEKATAEGRNIKLDVTMSEVGNVIEYQLLIKNDSEEDYEIDKTSININENYIDYSLEMDDGTKIVKAKTSRLVTLKVEYKTGVPEESFTNGVYSEQKHMVLKLQTDADEEIENPDTGGQMSTYIIILLGLLLISGIIYMTLRKKKYDKVLWLIGGLIITIPICINALCKCDINIDYKVTITTHKLSTFSFSCSNQEFEYEEGMTFADWIKSDYYPGPIYGKYDSLQKCEEIWGTNRGCHALDKGAYHIDTYIESYDSLQSCEENWGAGNCEEKENEYIHTEIETLDFESMQDCEDEYGQGNCHVTETLYYYQKSKKHYYETLEKCNDYWSSDCTPTNNLYVYENIDYHYESYPSLETCEEVYGQCELYDNIYYGVQKSYYSTLEECHNSIYEDSQCHLVDSTIYVHEEIEKNYYNSLQSCQENSNGNACIESSTNLYEPTIREVQYDNNDRIDGFAFSNNHEIQTLVNQSEIVLYELWKRDYYPVQTFIIPKYQKISSKKYICKGYEPFECVSPESNILIGDGKTKKAKDLQENDSIAYYDFKENRIRIGRIITKFIHKDATHFIKYTLEDNTYLEATDYHPIYTKDGWKSYTNKNNYPKPNIGDEVLTSNGYKKITKIDTYEGKEDYIDFKINTNDGKIVNNYFANGVLVEGSY